MSDFIGKSFGRYHILEQLGEGGMAIVFKGFDTRLERDVAIKVIRRDAFPPSQLESILKRFEREAKALARLSHLHIIKVIDYGEHEGSPYLVMEYMPGGTLKKCLGNPMVWQEAVRILIPIAEALEYAHENNIIHRDIKPSNILLTEKGEPMLTDFGIAKILDVSDAATLTGTGMGVGTPEYMAPEQWTGQSGAQSDIYSLGVVLYEMVTGRKPYTADTPAAILLKQASEPLPRPGAYVSDLPEVVEKVLVKALARNVKDRYQDIESFREALELLLEGQGKEKARRATVIQEVATPIPVDSGTQDTRMQDATFSTRLQEPTVDVVPPKPQPDPARDASTYYEPEPTNWRPWVIGIGVVAFLILCGLANNLYGSSARATQAPTLPTAVPVKISEPTEAPLATEAPAWESITAENADRLQLQTSWGGRGMPYSMDWSPDGRWLAIGTNIGLYLYDAKTMSEIWFIEETSWVRGVTFSPDGEYIAAGVGSQVMIWRTSDGAVIHALEGHTSSVFTVAFSPNGDLLASGSSNESVRLWNVQDGSLNYVLEGSDVGVRTLAFSPNGAVLATGSTDHLVRIWLLSDGSLLSILEGHGSMVRSLAYSPDGRLLASGSYDATIKIWDTASARLLYTLSGHSGGIMTLAFLPDSRQLLSGSSDHGIRIWDALTGTELLKFGKSHTGPVISARYSPDENRVASASMDGTVRLWDAQNGQMLDSMLLAPNPYSVAVSPQGAYIAVQSSDEAIHFFDMYGNEAGLYQANSISYFAMSPVDNSMAVTEDTGKIMLVAVPSGEIIAELEGSPDGIGSVAFSGDGLRLCVINYDNTVAVWDVFNRQQVATISTPNVSEPVVCSADGSLVAAGVYVDETSGYAVRLWRVSDGAVIQTLPEYESGFKSISLSPDAQTIAFNAVGGGIKLYSMATGSLIRTLDDYAGYVMMFSPDGEMLFSTGTDTNVQIWRVSDGQLLSTLNASRAFGVSDFAFAPDMSFLVLAAYDTTTQVWQVTPP